MTSPMALPPKEEVAKEIGKAANTLSDEMQTAVLTKARELGFDLNKGRLTLEETMINLTHNRDLLIAASRTGKLSQLPLKLQYSLYTQVRDISGVLTSIVNGTDAVLNLEDAVEDLTSSVWQYNLHNLSSEVLGFQEKMNQLKSQETLIRRVHREAQDFQTTLAHSQDVLSAIEDVLAQSTQRRDEIQSSVDQVATIAAKAIDSEQKIAAHATQAEQHNSATERHEAGARTADATAQAFAEKIPKLQSEIDEKQSALKQLIDQAREALDGFQNASEKSAAAFASQYDELKSSTDSQLRRILGDIEQAKSEAKASTDELRNDTRSQLDTMQSTQDSKVEATIKKGEDAIQNFERDVQTVLNVERDKLQTQAGNASKEYDRLVKELDNLESQIRESIRRATGFSLFHSFQERQHSLVRSKNFWALALGGVVFVSIGLSIYLVWELSQVQSFGATFYLKLSISLPIIYAIWFCTMQYSRERRLEEEYAFKSSISISLDPYRELVEKLVDHKDPSEVAKYTAFVIESIGRVFTSPTERVFDHAKDSTPAEGIISAVSDLVKDVLKVAKK